MRRGRAPHRGPLSARRDRRSASWVALAAETHHLNGLVYDFLKCHDQPSGYFPIVPRSRSADPNPPRFLCTASEPKREGVMPRAAPASQFMFRRVLGRVRRPEAGIRCVCQDLDADVHRKFLRPPLAPLCPRPFGAYTGPFFPSPCPVKILFAIFLDTRHIEGWKEAKTPLNRPRGFQGDKTPCQNVASQRS